MNFWDQFMGQPHGPSMGDEGYPPRVRDGSRFPQDFAAGYMQPAMHANTGGGLPAMAQGFPSAQTGGGLPPMGYDSSGINPGNVGTGGYDAPRQFNANTGGGMPPQAMGLQAHTGGGFQPQQMGNQGSNGLARMFRGFSPYGRPMQF